MQLDKITLEELKHIDFTKTALEDIKQEVIDYIKNHPDFSTKWDNFYDSDSGKMIVDTFAYLMKKLLVRVDLMANETFPSTSQQASSTVKVLKLLGYELRSTTQGQVFINVGYVEGRPESEINLGTEYALPCSDTEGNSINFYLRNNTTDYFSPVKLTLSPDGKAQSGLVLKAYSGELRIDSIDRSDIISEDSEVYTLDESPVVEGSIRVFYYDATDTRQEAVAVDSFFNVPYDADYIPYIIHFNEFGNAYIEFGDIDLVNILPDYKNIEIYYCIGGGATHNVVENSINITDSFAIPEIAGGNVSIEFSNPGKAFGGKDAETIEEAKNTAPLSLKTINRTVTESDYSILLAKHGSVLHSKILSPNDNRDYFPIESEIPLFYVWIYITLNKEVDSMDDLLLSKQVDSTGTLIGGDVYDILDYLKDKRIVGIENVIKPTTYTRLFFSLKIEYNEFIDLNTIEEDARSELNDLYNISNTGYGKLVRLNDIISNLKKNVSGIFDVEILFFRIKRYDQILDTVASTNYFRYIDTNPEYVEIVDSTYDLPDNYQSEYNEVVFLLDNFNDVQMTFIAVEE